MLLAAIDRNEMVQRFLDMYAAEFRRPGAPTSRRFTGATAGGPARSDSGDGDAHRVVFADAAEGERDGSRREAAHERKKGAKAKPAKRAASMELGIPFLDLFREEFFVALDRRWNGPTRMPRDSGATWLL